MLEVMLQRQVARLAFHYMAIETLPNCHVECHHESFELIDPEKIGRDLAEHKRRSFTRCLVGGHTVGENTKKKKNGKENKEPEGGHVICFSQTRSFSIGFSQKIGA